MAKPQEKRSAKTSVVLVPQPHGGALQQGNPGNAGGVGVIPSVVRAACRAAFAERVPRLRDIADGRNGESVKEQILAMRVLAQHAGLERTQGNRLPPEVRDRLEAQADLLLTTDLIPAEHRHALIAQLHEIWKRGRR